jgi:response regulator RpfG family c-di-GMP phosphodiesterase
MKDKPAILYVDSEVNNINSLIAILRKDNYRVIPAGSIQEGFDILQKQLVGIIICGKWVAGVKGVDFLASTIPGYPDASRLLVSAYHNEDPENKAHIYDYLVTPWDEIQLKSILKAAYESFLSRSAVNGG